VNSSKIYYFLIVDEDENIIISNKSENLTTLIGESSVCFECESKVRDHIFMVIPIISKTTVIDWEEVGIGVLEDCIIATRSNTVLQSKIDGVGDVDSWYSVVPRGKCFVAVNSEK
jgi:hypothetical protein